MADFESENGQNPVISTISGRLPIFLCKNMSGESVSEKNSASEIISDLEGKSLPGKDPESEDLAELKTVLCRGTGESEPEKDQEWETSLQESGYECFFCERNSESDSEMFPEPDFSSFKTFFCDFQPEKKQTVTSPDSCASFVNEEMDLCQPEEAELPEFYNDGGTSLFSSVGKTANKIKDGGKPFPLYKQRSLSNDTYRDEAWLKRKDNSKRRSKSVTDEDLDELRGCIELGFGFDSEDQKLSDTLPALDLYYAINKQYNDCNSKFSSSDSSASPNESPHRIFGPGDDPQLVKMRLRHWAQVVACSVRQCC